MESKNPRVKSWASAKLGALPKSTPPKSGANEKAPATPERMSRRIATLVRQLKDDDAGVRHSAAVALGNLGVEAISAVPALVERIQDDVWTVGGITQDNASGNTSKDAALAALKKLAKDKVEGALMVASESKNKTVRAWANAKLAETEKSSLVAGVRLGRWVIRAPGSGFQNLRVR